MSRFTFVLVIVAVLAASIQGSPTYQDDVANAAAAGDWDKVHEILARSFGNFGKTPFVEIRGLKPQGGGHVFAEADLNFKSSSSAGGVVSQQSGGHRVVNADGQVSEFDYKP